jgi:hypothetical protein
LSDSEFDKVAREILSYFVRNPHAADDLEGIARWRLLNETVHRKVDETRAALARLVECGLLKETKQTGIESIFTLDPAKRADAERIVSDPEPPGSEPPGPS